MNPKHISLKPGKTFVLLLIMALETLQLCTDVFCQAFLLISLFLVPSLGSKTFLSSLYSGSPDLQLLAVSLDFFLLLSNLFVVPHQLYESIGVFAEPFFCIGSGVALVGGLTGELARAWVITLQCIVVAFVIALPDGCVVAEGLPGVQSLDMIVVVLRGIEEYEFGESTLVVMVRNIDRLECGGLTAAMRSRTQMLKSSMM